MIWSVSGQLHFQSQHLGEVKQHVTAYLHGLYHLCTQSSSCVLPADAMFAYCTPEALSPWAPLLKCCSISEVHAYPAVPHAYVYTCPLSSPLVLSPCPLPLSPRLITSSPVSVPDTQGCMLGLVVFSGWSNRDSLNIPCCVRCMCGSRLSLRAQLEHVG